MNNDKVFAIYALGLVAAVLGMWTLAVASQVGTLPAFAFLVEHVALGLLIRGGYKSFAGFDWFFRALELSGMFAGAQAEQQSAEVEPAGSHLAHAA